MIAPSPLRRRPSVVVVLSTLLVAAVLSTPAGHAQSKSPPASEVDDPDARLEEMFQNALELSDEEPFQALQAWGAVMMATLSLEKSRAMEQTGSADVDADAVTAEVLARWRKLRPESGGPDLFLAMNNRDQDARNAALIALLDRYPDDPLVLWQAAFALRQTGQMQRATEAVEAFATRHPDQTLSYRLLVQDARGNATRLADALQRWFRAVPSDPAMVMSWLYSTLPRQEPEMTAQMLGAFFDGRPAEPQDLNACRQVLRSGGPAFEDRARACVIRIAGNPNAPSTTVESAISILVELAADDGDWSGLLGQLDRLEPKAKVRSLISAARKLEAPARCPEALDLLAVASEALGEDDASYGLLSGALRSCSDRPEAQALLTDLLRRAPAEATRDVVSRWLVQVNGTWRGKVPSAAIGILEQRLQAEADAPGLYEALDIVYQLEQAEDKRLDLLGRWQKLGDRSFGSRQAEALATGLASRGQLREAIDVLEQRREVHLRFEGLELLWGLYRESAGEERAARFAAELMASDDESVARSGHRLTARTFMARGDFDAAESHYWQALGDQVESRDLAVELLVAVGRAGDPGRTEAAARRICSKMSSGQSPAEETACATDLVARSGGGDAAISLLTAGAAELPNDAETLQKVANAARSAGQEELLERSLRRLLEVDPRNESNWSSLGDFLEKQGRSKELVELLARAREAFPTPPISLYRSAGRALTQGGRPEQAIEILTEGRRTLPETSGGAWSRSWIDQEIRAAYRVIGQDSAAISSTASAPAPSPAFATSIPQTMPADRVPDLRAAAIALQSGQGGRYDPGAAAKLFARAASLGDPLAAFRLAHLSTIDPSRVLPEGMSTDGLYRHSVRQVHELAEQGNSYAQYLVGSAALAGLGGPKDFTVARRWLEAAAAGGESWAWHNLGWMQETGKGFAQSDPVLALTSYQRAAEAGNTQSMVDLARLTLTQYASGTQCKEGLRWLERSAEAGNAVAAAFLGKLLFYGRGECVPRSAQASLRWLEGAATAHRPGADYDLGLALILTAPDEASRARGLALLEQSASLNNPLAVDTLAFLYATGIQVPRDADRARSLMDEGARLGSDGLHRLREQVALSALYQDLLERGTARLEALAARKDAFAATFLARLERPDSALDETEAVSERVLELARLGAAGGEASAMRILGDAYVHGTGVEKDPIEAIRWRRRGAEAGDSFCMMFYAQALMDGKRVDQDLKAGLAWLRKAGEAGNWWAIADLGNLYDEGWYGLPRDPEEAAVWKKRLADLGDPAATGWLIYHGYR